MTTPITQPTMNDPLISICRRSKSWAVFDGPDCVKDFEKYELEPVAIFKGRAFCSERTSVEPRIIYPRITKMRMSS